MNYTYLLECSDHSFYCGWTNDLDKRVMAHNSGNGANITKSRRPVALVYYETYETKEAAMKREAAIKRMSRREKERLIFGGPEPDGGQKTMAADWSQTAARNMAADWNLTGGQIRGRAGDSRREREHYHGKRRKKD